MRRAIAYSFLVEFATMVSMVATFKIAADAWGSDGFGEWALTRRILAFLLPLIVCGMDVAIPRYVAIAVHGRSEYSAASYMAGAMMLTVATLLLGTVLLFVFRSEVARWLFGDVAYLHLVTPLWALVAGYALYLPCYGYLRGRMKIMEANLVHVIMYGALPLSALALFPLSPAAALLGLGSLSAALAAACIAYIVRDSGLSGVRMMNALRVLVGYGAPRMLAAFGLMALAALPAVVAAHSDGIQQAGYVVFSLTLVGMAASAAAPIGVTILPLASSLAAAGQVVRLRAPLLRLEASLAAASVAGIVLVWWLAPTIARVFFSGDAGDVVPLLRLAAIGAGPFAYFACVRNIIDATTERGVNTSNVLVALILFTAIMATGLVLGDVNVPTLAVVAYVAGVSVLAFLSWRAVHRLLLAELSRAVS